MAEQIKFTEQEVNQINELRQGFTRVFLQLGELTIDKKKKIEEFEILESELQQRHNELLQAEENIFKALNEKYGDGNYDPNTGIFTPIENNETVIS